VPDAQQLRARYPEAIAACSRHLAGPVIQVWLDKCDRPSPGPGVELWGVGGDPGTAIGTADPARIDQLRAAGCPVAVLCTSSNAYLSLMASLSESAKAKVFTRARKRARPSSTKPDGAFLGILPIHD
jgi:hypothetical protein